MCSSDLPNENIERGHMWDELVGIQQYWRLPWCCFGDFNIVHFPSERKGEARLTLLWKNSLNLLRILTWLICL